MGEFKKACLYPRCPYTTENRHKRYCIHHSMFENEGRRRKDLRRKETRNKIYNTAAWKKLSKTKKMNNPICERCKNRMTSDIHHIKPVREYPELALDYDNLEALCKRCHSIETAKEAHGGG